MSDEQHMHGVHAQSQPTLHPLEPLTAEEIKQAVDIVRTA
jgi:Cu2+-containing amine oxidase